VELKMKHLLEVMRAADELLLDYYKCSPAELGGKAANLRVALIDLRYALGTQTVTIQETDHV